MDVLSGIRVVELGVWVAGPSAAGLLADWGADVIKVESPAGDPMRAMLAATSGHRAAASPPFDLDNRGKRSVVLDLTTDEGRADLDALLATADVLITNLRPEAVDRMGFGSERVRAEHPHLVYGQTTGFGRTGPDAHRAGYDIGAFWARSGMAESIVPPGQAPPASIAGSGDHTTGLSLAAGVLAALVARTRTGEGTVVDTSLLRTGIYALGWDLGIQLRFGKHAPTVGRDGVQNPMMNCYRAADDRWFWLLGLEADRHWPPTLAAIDRGDLADDERFATSRDRRKNAAALIAIFDETFASAPRAHWLARFDEHDVWWAPVNTLADTVDDPQAIAAGAFVDVPDGAGATAHRAVATPVDFGGRHTPARGAVPGLGEHTDEVLAEVRDRRAT